MWIKFNFIEFMNSVEGKCFKTVASMGIHIEFFEKEQFQLSFQEETWTKQTNIVSQI